MGRRRKNHGADQQDDVGSVAVFTEREVQRVQLAAPLAEVTEEEYCPRHVEVMLKGSQPVGMKRWLCGLIAEGATLSNGRVVQNPADVVRWLCELAASAEIGGDNGSDTD